MTNNKFRSTDFDVSPYSKCCCWTNNYQTFCFTIMIQIILFGNSTTKNICFAAIPTHRQFFGFFVWRFVFWKIMSASPAPINSLNSKRWHCLRHILERAGPFCKADFTPAPDNLDFLQNTCKILVIGMFR